MSVSYGLSNVNDWINHHKLFVLINQNDEYINLCNFTNKLFMYNFFHKEGRECFI